MSVKSLGASSCLPEAPARLIVPLIRLNCFLARSRENDTARNPTKGYGHAADRGLDFLASETLLRKSNISCKP